MLSQFFNTINSIVMSEKEILLQKVEAAIDQLRPFLEADGGNIELLDITSENVVKVKFLGACRSCSMSAMTLKGGVEESIKKAAPQIVSVVAVESESVAEETVVD